MTRYFLYLYDYGHKPYFWGEYKSLVNAQKAGSEWLDDELDGFEEFFFTKNSDVVMSPCRQYMCSKDSVTRIEEK